MLGLQTTCATQQAKSGLYSSQIVTSAAFHLFFISGHSLLSEEISVLIYVEVSLLSVDSLVFLLDVFLVFLPAE